MRPWLPWALLLYMLPQNAMPSLCKKLQLPRHLSRCGHRFLLLRPEILTLPVRESPVPFAEFVSYAVMEQHRADTAKDAISTASMLPTKPKRKHPGVAHPVLEKAIKPRYRRRRIERTHRRHRAPIMADEAKGQSESNLQPCQIATIHTIAPATPAKDPRNEPRTFVTNTISHIRVPSPSLAADRACPTHLPQAAACLAPTSP